MKIHSKITNAFKRNVIVSKRIIKVTSIIMFVMGTTTIFGVDSSYFVTQKGHPQ